MDYVEVVAIQRAVDELEALIARIKTEAAKYEVKGCDHEDHTYAQGMRYATWFVADRLKHLKQEDIRKGNDNGSE